MYYKGIMKLESLVYVIPANQFHGWERKAGEELRLHTSIQQCMSLWTVSMNHKNKNINTRNELLKSMKLIFKFLVLLQQNRNFIDDF